MEKADSLTDNEKVFLAGCIKTLILADGEIDDFELADLDKITKDLQFKDFDNCLNNFENTVHDSDSFWQEAEKITKKETRDMILSILYELSLQSGYMQRPEENLINKLKMLWS